MVKALRGRGFNVDEVMGLSATYERAPGYSELAQITTPEINFLKGNTIDKDFSRIFDKVIKGEQNLDSEIKKFNKDSRIFQKNFGVDTPIIEYTPGKKLDASKFIKHFDKLTPEAKAKCISTCRPRNCFKIKSNAHDRIISNGKSRCSSKRTNL